MGSRFVDRNEIFVDRRVNIDRRRQGLPIPANLCRRHDSDRRRNAFNAKPWWLLVNYLDETRRSVELVPYPYRG